jgi:hypothetical protein
MWAEAARARGKDHAERAADKTKEDRDSAAANPASATSAAASTSTRAGPSAASKGGAGASGSASTAGSAAGGSSSGGGGAGRVARAPLTATVGSMAASVISSASGLATENED